jgi:hypothetical protein
MNQAKQSKIQRGRKAAMAIASKSALALYRCLRIATAVLWLGNAVGDDAAASPALTVLAAVINLGKILTGLDN